MCNLDMSGVFSGVKFNSEPLFFLGYGQKMLPLGFRDHFMDRNMSEMSKFHEKAQKNIGEAKFQPKLN